MEGHTAIRHRNSSPFSVRVQDTNYAFTPKFNISLAWVKDEHVAQVLSVKRGCCGGSKKPRFFLADETHIRRWTQGGR